MYVFLFVGAALSQLDRSFVVCATAVSGGCTTGRIVGLAKSALSRLPADPESARISRPSSTDVPLSTRVNRSRSCRSVCAAPGSHGNLRDDIHPTLIVYLALLVDPPDTGGNAEYPGRNKNLMAERQNLRRQAQRRFVYPR